MGSGPIIAKISKMRLMRLVGRRLRNLCIINNIVNDVVP
jgi:hypothetical protein